MPAPRAKDAPRTMRDLRARAPGQAARPARRRDGNPLREGLRLERVPGPEHARPVRRHRRPRPSQGHPGALPAVADEPPAARVRDRRDRPPAVRRRDLPGRSSRASLEQVLAGPAARRGRLAPVRVADPLPPAATSTTAPATTRSSTTLEAIDKEHETRAATACSTSRRSRRRSPRSSPSSAGSGSTTSATRAAGGGSSSRSRSATTSSRRSA